MKCSLFHAVGSRFELHRMFATLVLLACAIGAQAEGLLDAIQTKNVTVSWNDEYGQPYGWLLSENPDYMPGWVSQTNNRNGYSYLRLESEKQYTISFDYVATKVDDSYISYNLESSDGDYSSESLWLSAEPQTFSATLQPGWCYFSLRYNNYSSNSQIYIYNFRVIACNHKGDTSEPTGHVEATCQHGSYDVHVCSECGVKYNGAQANDKKDHVDADQDHKCDVCESYTHPDTDHDGMCDVEDCGQVALETIVKTYNATLTETYCESFVPSTNDNYKPGLMSGPAKYYEYSDVWESYNSMSLYFQADIPYTFSFDYVASDACDSDIKFETYSEDEGYGSEKLFFTTTPQTYSKTFNAGGGEISNLNCYVNDPDTKLYIYNIRIVACDHNGDTSEPTGHVEATCAHGSHDVYTCSICGCEYDGPEADDKVSHSDADNNCFCDVCGAPILEKMFEISEGIKASFESLDGRGCLWEANAYYDEESSTYYSEISTSMRSEEWCYALITIQSPKDFTLSFDHSCDGDTWDDRMGYYNGSASFLLYDEEGKNAWNTWSHDPIEEWYASETVSTASCDLPAGTYYLYLSASCDGYRCSGDAILSNLKALYIESAIEKKAHDYQRFIMNHEDLSTDNSGIEDLNEDGKITVGDITIAIDRALKDEESGE